MYFPLNSSNPLGCIISGFAFPHFSPDVPCYISFLFTLSTSFIPLAYHGKRTGRSLLRNDPEVDGLHYRYERKHPQGAA